MHTGTPRPAAGARADVYYTYDLETADSGYKDVSEHGVIESRPSTTSSLTCWNQGIREILSLLKHSRYTSNAADDIEELVANREYASITRIATDVTYLCATACGHKRVPTAALRSATRKLVITMYDNEVEFLKSFSKSVDDLTSDMQRFMSNAFTDAQHLCRMQACEASRDVDPEIRRIAMRVLLEHRLKFCRWFASAPEVVDWVASLPLHHHVVNPTTLGIVALHTDLSRLGRPPTLATFVHWLQCHEWSQKTAWEPPVEDAGFESIGRLVDEYVRFFARDMTFRHFGVEEALLGSPDALRRLHVAFCDGGKSLTAVADDMNAGEPLRRVARSLLVNENGVCNMLSTLGARVVHMYQRKRICIDVIETSSATRTKIFATQEEALKNRLLTHEETETVALFVRRLAKSRRPEDVEQYKEVRRTLLQEVAEESVVEVEGLSTLLQNKILLMARARKQRFTIARKQKLAATRTAKPVKAPASRRV